MCYTVYLYFLIVLNSYIICREYFLYGKEIAKDCKKCDAYPMRLAVADIKMFFYLKKVLLEAVIQTPFLKGGMWHQSHWSGHKELFLRSSAKTA